MRIFAKLYKAFRGLFGFDSEGVEV